MFKMISVLLVEVGLTKHTPSVGAEFRIPVPWTLVEFFKHRVGRSHGSHSSSLIGYTGSNSLVKALILFHYIIKWPS